jgi:hypothetical protein
LSGDSHDVATTPSSATTPAQKVDEPKSASDAEARAVISDWWDDGAFDEPHGCAAVRAAIERLPWSGAATSSAASDVGRYEARVCGDRGTKAAQARLPVRPLWVVKAVDRVREAYGGNPDIVRVSWNEFSTEWSVYVVFSKPEACVLCGRPAGSTRQTRIKRVTVYYSPGGEKITHSIGHGR